MEQEDPNGELQVGVATSGANTVMDGRPTREKFMGSEKVKIKVNPAWKVAKGHQTHRNGGGTHSDKRLKRLKTRNNQNKRAIQDYF